MTSFSVKTACQSVVCKDKILAIVRDLNSKISAASVRAGLVVDCTVVEEIRLNPEESKVQSLPPKTIRLCFAGKKSSVVTKDYEIYQDSNDLIVVLHSLRKISCIHRVSHKSVEFDQPRSETILLQERALERAVIERCSDSVVAGQEVKCITVVYATEDQKKLGVNRAIYIISKSEILVSAVYFMLPKSRVTRMTISYSPPSINDCSKTLGVVASNVYSHDGSILKKYTGYTISKKSW